MQAWNTNRLFRQVQIRMFNPPYTKLGFRSEDDPDQLRQRAHEAISAGEPEEFIRWVKSQVQDWTTSSLCLHLVGQALKVAGCAEEARSYLLQALALRRADGVPLQIASTLLGLSEVARFQNDIPLAWRYLNEAIEVYPRYRSAHLNRLCLASLSEDLDLLAQLYDEMCQLYPDWSQDQALCQGLQDDGELGFLRSTELWETIQTQMKQKDFSSNN